MRIGFVTGSIARIGSGRTEAVPLARAFLQQGCDVYGLETARFKRSRLLIDGLEVNLEPVLPYLASRYIPMIRSVSERVVSRGWDRTSQVLSKYDLATSDALLMLSRRLELDVVYAFHNTNVARLLPSWPDPSRLLAINLIGFGIDPSRGGAANTFPLQNLIFERPYWDLHIAATRFEFEQYLQVYERLGIDPGKLVYLPHSYDEEVFQPSTTSSSERHRERSRDSAIVLYPVNVYRRKNIELAIDVIAALIGNIDCHLVVSGSIWDKEYHASLLQRARDRGVSDRVTFHGGVSLDVLVELYQHASVTVYTSHQETFGHGIVESLGCGTPVVGPDWIIPCREILDGSPGCWIAPKNSEQFASAVYQALSTVHDRECLASYARARYGNRAVAGRFLKRCHAIKADRDSQRANLASIDWKGLYKDAGDLL